MNKVDTDLLDKLEREENKCKPKDIRIKLVDMSIYLLGK